MPGFIFDKNVFTQTSQIFLAYSLKILMLCARQNIMNRIMAIKRKIGRISVFEAAILCSGWRDKAKNILLKMVFMSGNFNQKSGAESCTNSLQLWL